MRELAEVAKDWRIEADLDIAQEINRWGVSCLPLHNLGECRD
jgi:hypothetical protein